jgi:predicted transcriptional regulator
MNSYTLTIIPGTGAEPELKLDTLDIKKSAIILRAVNHKLRQVMLKYIGEKGQVTVTEIFEHLLLCKNKKRRKVHLLLCKQAKAAGSQ